MLSWLSLSLLKILSTRMNSFSLKESIGGKFLGVREERRGVCILTGCVVYSCIYYSHLKIIRSLDEGY